MNKVVIYSTSLILLLAGFVAYSSTKFELNSFSFKNAKQPYENIIAGGQPSLEDLKKLSALNIKNVVNLRVAGEFNEFNEANEVKSLGLNYVSLEIKGASGITLENAEKLDTILKSLEGDSFVHCASGNRVGALFAVRAATINGKSITDALIEGKNAGLGSLYNKTETLLSGLTETTK